jgi:hypothetical protein
LARGRDGRILPDDRQSLVPGDLMVLARETAQIAELAVHPNDISSTRLSWRYDRSEKIHPFVGMPKRHKITKMDLQQK